MTTAVTWSLGHMITGVTWSLSSHDHWVTWSLQSHDHWVTWSLGHMITNELTWSCSEYINVTRRIFRRLYPAGHETRGYHSSTCIYMLGEFLTAHTHTHLSLPQIPPSWHQSDVSRLSPGGGRRRHCLEGTKEDRPHQEIPQGHLLGPPRLPHLWYLPSHNDFSADIPQIKTHVLITRCSHFRGGMVSSLYWWQCPEVFF